jgi:Asp-tRNA(Asn)/Glu-tRNA(Gln) amidotransferase A subunit family amidase
LALPDEFAALTDVHATIMEYEVARSLHYEWTAHRDRLGAQIKARIERGLTGRYGDYADALRHAAAARRIFREIVEPYDAVLTPSVVGEAPPGLAETGDRRFQSLWTVLHSPSLTLPTHKGPAGLPVGMQLVGHHGRDMALVAVARWVSEKLGRN